MENKTQVKEMQKKTKKGYNKPTFGPPKGHSPQEFFLNMVECYCLGVLALFSIYLQ